MNLEFSGEMWFWKGPAPWQFWVDWYNHRRPFEYCDDLTPVEAETAHYAHHRAQQQPKLSNH